MTPAQFRALALSLPGANEGAHIGHADFRVGGKVFATLGYPNEDWGMVKLPPEMQEMYVAARPDVFTPVKGAWGRRGSTSVRLDAATRRKLEGALRTAWESVTKTSGRIAR
jgi:hypothetical protein